MLTNLIRTLFLFLLSILLYNCRSDNLLIKENGHGKYKLDQTSLRRVYWEHLFSKKRKKETRGHAMWRTDEGRFCTPIFRTFVQISHNGIFHCD